MNGPPKDHGYIDFVGAEEHFWKIETLWAAARDAPVREVRVSDLPWREDGCHVLGEPPTWGSFADHCRRALNADVSHPIILGPNGDVMDGMHRIVRAHLEGRESLSAVMLDVVPPPDRVRLLKPGG